MWKKKTLETRQKLSRAMGSYWASFARTGMPAPSKLPSWPTFGRAANLIYLDSDNDAGIQVQAGADTVESLVSDLKVDARLSTQQRCEIAKGLLEWTSDLELALSGLITASCQDN